MIRIYYLKNLPLIKEKQKEQKPSWWTNVYNEGSTKNCRGEWDNWKNTQAKCVNAGKRLMY